MKLQVPRETTRKTYIEGQLLGVEKRASPSEVGKGRASHMRNFWLSDGVNKKRNGWRQISIYKDEDDKPLKINGIYSYMGRTLVHAGNYLFDEGKRAGGAQLDNLRSCGFENDGFLYIISGDGLFLYDGSVITDLYNSPYSYIPTTAYLMPINNINSYQRAEDDNLLTQKRVNGLFGVRQESNLERVEYKLDSRVDLDKPVTVTTKINIALNSHLENIAPYCGTYKEVKRLTSDNIEGVMGYSDEEEIFKILDGEGATATLGAVEEIALFLKSPIKVSYARFKALEGGVVPRMSFYCGGDLIYESEGVYTENEVDLGDTLSGQVIDTIYLHGNKSNDNIDKIDIKGQELYEGEVEIIHQLQGASYERAIKPASIKAPNGKDIVLSKNLSGSTNQPCSIFLRENLGDNEGLLFCFCNVGVSPHEPNIYVEYTSKDTERTKMCFGEVMKTSTGSPILVTSDGEATACFSCGVKGFTYFPSSLKRKIGTDEKITAICPMSDFTLGVFKENEVYYFKAQIKDNKTELEAQQYCGAGGSLSHFATKRVNLDTLSLTKNGVFGSVGASSTRAQRSSNILNDLSRLNLSDAIAISHNGGYYLFVNGYVYIADTGYKHYVNNRQDSSFEYEWWMLDNCPVSCVEAIDGKIYMGREDGRICVFYDGYLDIYYESLSEGSILFEKGQNGITNAYINEALGLKAGDKLLISSAYIKKADIVSKEIENGFLKLYLSDSQGEFMLYPNMEIYLQGESGELIYTTIREALIYENAILVNLEENSDTYLGIYTKTDGEVYTLKEKDDYFTLVDKYQGEAYLEETHVAEVLCEKSTPVCAEYVSSLIFGNEAHIQKRLCQLTVNLLGESRGLIEMGYETDRSVRVSLGRADSGFDFDSLDFESVSFDTALQKSYTFRCFERRFGSLLFKLKHKENAPLAIKSFLVVYS